MMDAYDTIMDYSPPSGPCTTTNHGAPIPLPTPQPDEDARGYKRFVESLAQAPCVGGYHGDLGWAANTCIGMRDHARAHPEHYDGPHKILQSGIDLCLTCKARDVIATRGALE
jgi:hypothetical protein